MVVDEEEKVALATRSRGSDCPAQICVHRLEAFIRPVLSKFSLSMKPKFNRLVGERNHF
jgi:hypothetical protein